MSNPFWNDLESNVKKAKKSAQDSAEKAKKHKERGDRAVRWWLDCKENNQFFRMKTVHIGIIVLSIVSIVFFITRKNCLINEQCISSDESKETCGSNKCFRNEDLIIFWTIYGLALLLFIIVFITQFIYDMKNSNNYSKSATTSRNYNSIFQHILIVDFLVIIAVPIIILATNYNSYEKESELCS